VTAEEYAQLAAECDRLLRAPDTSLARLAIPALHVIYEHPGFLSQYGQTSTGLTHVPRVALRAARGLGRSVAAHRAATPQPADVVIVSHLSNPTQLDQPDDFYFGALQRFLRERGISSLLVLIDHLPRESATQPPAQAEPRMILPRAVAPATELGIWRQCLSAAATLRQEGTQVARLASRQALSAATAINLRMHTALSSLCQAVNPRLVITTYEGDAAERVIWHAARTARRRPLCVGYQHARILKHAHAIRRPVAAPGLDCDPDVILTLGEVPHKILASSPALSATRFIEYGSHRSALPSGVEFPRPEERSRQCVVLPDADDQECASLFGFAVATANQRPDVRFVLRPHPIVDTQSLIKRHRTLQSLPGNVTLSCDTPLTEDLSRSRYCLYRSSSAAMQAVLAGIKPFYLARPGELPIDPLFELTCWRETVTSPAELDARMSAAEATPDPEAAASACHLYQSYASPVRAAAIDELLSLVTQ
jgi:hypothetical protein